MMLGIEGYGSDESDSETAEPKLKPYSPNQSSTSLAPLPAPTAKVPLPPPRPKRAPKKFAISLPLPTSKDDNHNDLEGVRPPAKKPRLDSGAGTSSLLSMLPAPKQKNPVLPPPERILGGGRGPGLVFFSTPRPPSTSTDGPVIFGHDNGEGAEPTIESASSVSLPFIPPSLKKGHSNISVEDFPTIFQPSKKIVSAAPPVDPFSLASSPKNPAAASSSTPPTAPTLSSAPDLPTFEPPEPSQTDPYPGYYQLPSGTWEAHDPSYFARFVKKWEAEYNAHVRALEKGAARGFEGLETAAVEEVDAMREMEKAKVEIQEREERKAVTKGADGGPIAPKMNINASKLSGIARSRHQLSTLLKEAYENREALEEKIAQGRRNRKEAGNKYGF